MEAHQSPRDRYTLKMVLTRMGIIIGVTAVIQFGLMLLPQRGLHKLSEYQSILAQCDEPQIVAHFPKAIPTEANQGKLFFIKGAMGQGGDLQLRLTMGQSFIEKLAIDLAASVKWQYIGGNMVTHYELDRVNNVPTTYFFTGDEKGKYTFPDSYTLYILEAIDLSDPTLGIEGSWTHGHTRGVAINQTENIVVYWVRKW